MRHLIVVAFLVSVLSFNADAFAQVDRATLTGVVRDPSNAKVVQTGSVSTAELGLQVTANRGDWFSVVVRNSGGEPTLISNVIRVAR